MRLSCEDHVSRNAASTYVRKSRMRVPSARYVSHSRMASWKGISLMSKQFTHLYKAAMLETSQLPNMLHC